MQREARADGEAALRARARLELSPEGGDSLAHAHEAAAFAGDAGGDPAAAVDDLDRERVVLVTYSHGRARLAGVLERVGQRFLDDAVGGEIEAGRQRARVSLHAQGDGQPGLADLLAQPLQLAEARGGVEPRGILRAPDDAAGLDAAPGLGQLE